MPPGLRIGFIEPHLKRYGGIRRIVELSNALVERGHEVTIYLPEWERMECTWLRCDAKVSPIRDGFDDELDAVFFNHEPQWHLALRFERARIRGFYALHYSKLYGKEGSWESLRTPVEMQLANSTWTAAMVESEIGHRPEVLLGGINPQHFRPVDVPKRYPLLCVGDDRDWKGTETIHRAAELLDLPLESYAGKDLPQSEMATEYSRAEVFVVGSEFEGFGQPGLEALACGTPLVTTDNGGCRDYAIHEETALLVPPNDPPAMAEAIRRLRTDRGLARQLVRNGLELVAERFRWDRSAERFEVLLHETLSGAVDRSVDLRPNLREAEVAPDLSVVLLAWDQLVLTQRCVESIRQHTDLPYELIIVDNGSRWDAVNYAREAADRPVLHGSNLGFAKGMNAGLHASTAPNVLFLNNDTEVSAGWANRLVETLESHPEAGVVVPALTTAGNERTVRSERGREVEVLAPFEAPPSGVAYLMRVEQARRLGGWDEGYEVASGEDVDLAFKVWVNDLDIVYDTTVLIEHVGHGTSDAKLMDREQLWARNREYFFKKWQDRSVDVPRLASCPSDRFTRNRATAASVAGWMERYFRHRDLARELQRKPRRSRGRAGGLHAAARLVPDPIRRRIRDLLRTSWYAIRDHVPDGVRSWFFERLRPFYYRLFPERHPAALRGERDVPDWAKRS